MRILMEPSDYTFLNVGDMAMLQVAVRRLSTLWPDAYIQVLTDDPASLVFHYPNAQPLIRTGRQMWLADGYLFGAYARYLPRSVTTRLVEMERSLRRNSPLLANSMMRFRIRPKGTDNQALSAFLEAVSEADLMVVGGMGGITDAFEEYAFELLDTLGPAIQRGTPTAMFGQGIGPLQNPKLKARAKEILPQIAFIALREGRAGSPLLVSLGVAPDRILTTGDDAIELAYQLRPELLGTGIGVNLRLGWYSEVDEHLVERVRPILQDAAQTRNAPMVPLPISRTPGEEDILTIRQLTSGYHHVFDDDEKLDTPFKVIKHIQHCRIVVTGSYHGGVFALAQGIPTIGLANSAYYVDKFMGLAEQFGPGCEVVSLGDDQMPARLSAAIERAWSSAEQVRPQLLEAAVRQIELGRTAYQRVYELIKSRRVEAATPVKSQKLASAD